ncbi:uncharacterized protein G2W53_022005 [Senna tora]|uniref:Uncharacterized protein n=1 Tax=Senna tora TaxID=362788 RepID=A0A834TMR8_9FABA|nr:uncharacterized protein G2W53_022005 [Senna tora]
MAWEVRGSCLNIIRTRTRGRISENFTNYEGKDLLRNGFDVPIGVVKAWEVRGSCLNIFRMTNHGRISENFMNYEAKAMLCKNVHELRGKRLIAQVSETRRFALYLRTRVDLMLELVSSRHGRSVDHVLTYFGRKIAVGSKKASRITRQKTCCAIEIEFIKAWEERGSCLNIFRMTNRGRISENFRNYETKDLLRKKIHELQGKRLVAQVSETRRFALYLQTIVDLMFQLESSRHGRSVDLVLTYSGRQIAVGSQKTSRITTQNTCCASKRNTLVRIVFANRSGFDAGIGVFKAWKDHGSCLNIFWMTNRGWMSETFTNYEAKDLLRKKIHELQGKRLVAQVSETRRFALYLQTVVDLMFQLESSRHGRSVDHVLTYSGQQIAVGSQKTSRITTQNTCCASKRNTLVRIVFANRSGFDAGIGVFKAWKEHGSCLNIFWMTNRGRISETFTNYEAKDLLRK